MVTARTLFISILVISNSDLKFCVDFETIYIIIRCEGEWENFVACPLDWVLCYWIQKNEQNVKSHIAFQGNHTDFQHSTGGQDRDGSLAVLNCSTQLMSSKHQTVALIFSSELHVIWTLSDSKTIPLDYQRSIAFVFMEKGNIHVSSDNTIAIILQRGILVQFCMFCCIVTRTPIKLLEMNVILVNLWIFIVFYQYLRYFLHRSTPKTPILE